MLIFFHSVPGIIRSFKYSCIYEEADFYRIRFNIYIITLNYYKVNKKVDNAIVLFEKLLIGGFGKSFLKLYI